MIKMSPFEAIFLFYFIIDTILGIYYKRKVQTGWHSDGKYHTFTQTPLFTFPCVLISLITGKNYVYVEHEEGVYRVSKKEALRIRREKNENTCL